MALTDDELREHSADQLLDLIIEEAAEVIHAASKAKRFGHRGSHPSYNNGRSNADGIAREMRQLDQTFRIYCGKVGMHYGSTLEPGEYDLAN
jgi:hypothetical protein